MGTTLALQIHVDYCSHILQEKAEELKRQQAEAIRRMQQEQMADMQVEITYFSQFTSRGMYTLTFYNFSLCIQKFPIIFYSCRPMPNGQILVVLIQ